LFAFIFSGLFCHLVTGLPFILKKIKLYQSWPDLKPGAVTYLAIVAIVVLITAKNQQVIGLLSQLEILVAGFPPGLFVVRD
jgi:hypothetical protein